MADRILTLTRLSMDERGTFGIITTSEGKELCRTGELPWRENKRGISCIPPGTYPAHRRMSTKRHYALFELEGVPNRSNIEIHIGNWVSGEHTDSEGCILVGNSFGVVNGQYAVKESADAFRRFMQYFVGIDRWTLVVENPPASVAT